MDIFCKIIKGEIPTTKVYETDSVIAIMDTNPFSPGHVLVIPKDHYTTILDMDDEIIAKVHAVAKVLIKKIEEDFPNVTGVKIIVNYGDEQKIKHYHMHLLPIYEEGKKPTMSQSEFAEILKK